MLLSLWLTVASAQEGEAPPVEEITVWGRAVDEARDAVEAAIVDLGYDKVKRKDDRTVFRADAGWKGKVVLTDQGTLRVLRRGPAFREVEPLPGTRFRPYPLCVVVPTYCVSAGSWYVSDRRWGGIEDDVVDGTRTELATLSERIADAAIADVLAELPVRLDALWTTGRPLLGEGERATYRARRAELLAFWDTRTETLWGQQVRAQVEGFVRAVVMTSDHPFTPDEQAAFEAARRSARPFPW